MDESDGREWESDFRGALSIGTVALVVKDIKQTPHVLCIRSGLPYAVDGSNRCSPVPRWKAEAIKTMVEVDVLTVGSLIRVRYGLDRLWMYELCVAGDVSKELSALARSHAITMLENHCRREGKDT
ncbi:hypothetical protein [Crossiella sp. CA198]|uniref:hypothetical protein n=1 Tax=Crossiella sp. CA198 TaxID=3455607 RepID=UPI003F8D4664